MGLLDPSEGISQTEALREELLDEIYAGAFGGGCPAMLLEEDTIRRAGAEELKEIVRRYGLF